MPHAVQMFARLSYGSLVLGLLSSIYLLPKLMASLGAQFDALGGIAFLAPVLLFSVAIPALLIWLAASKQQNWARIVFAVLFVLGVVFTLFDPTALKIGGLPSMAIFAIQTLMQGAGIAYVFSAAAKPWFNKPVSPTI